MCSRRHITVPNRSQGHHCEPNGVEIRRQVRETICLLQVRKLEDADEVGEEADRGDKHDTHSLLGLDQEFALNSKPNPRRKPILLAHFLGERVGVDAVVEGGADHEEEPEEHEGEQEVAEQESYLDITIALKRDVLLKVRNGAHHENQHFENEGFCEEALSLPEFIL